MYYRKKKIICGQLQKIFLSKRPSQINNKISCWVRRPYLIMKQCNFWQPQICGCLGRQNTSRIFNISHFILFIFLYFSLLFFLETLYLFLSKKFHFSSSFKNFTSHFLSKIFHFFFTFSLLYLYYYSLIFHSTIIFSSYYLLFLFFENNFFYLNKFLFFLLIFYVFYLCFEKYGNSRQF